MREKSIALPCITTQTAWSECICLSGEKHCISINCSIQVKQCDSLGCRQCEVMGVLSSARAHIVFSAREIEPRAKEVALD